MFHWKDFPEVTARKSHTQVYDFQRMPLGHEIALRFSSPKKITKTWELFQSPLSLQNPIGLYPGSDNFRLNPESLTLA